MNSKKICSFLLLIAIVFSFAHDFAFVTLDKEHHSVKEYVHDFTNDIRDENLNQSTSIHDIHSEYHSTIDVCQSKMTSFIDTQKIKAIFTQSTIVYSSNNFNFLKPPIS